MQKLECLKEQFNQKWKFVIYSPSLIRTLTFFCRIQFLKNLHICFPYKATVYVGQAPKMTEKYCKSSLCNTISLLSGLNLD